MAPNPGPERKPLPGISEEKNLPPQGLPNTRNRTQPNGAPTRMDRIASTSDGRLRGTVVSDDRITPKAGAKIFFANVAKQGTELSAQADPAGRFAIELPPGEWNLFMTGADGKPVFHSQIAIAQNDQRLVTVVSR